MFCQLIPLRTKHIDICKVSNDCNPGAYNVFVYCGKAMGLGCLLLDILKGFAPVLLTSLVLGYENYKFALVIVAPVFGHAVGLFNNFKGGKCIAVFFGVTLGLIAVAWECFVILAILYVAFSIVIKIKSHRLRSIIVFVLFGVSSSVVCCLLHKFWVALGCFLISAIAVAKHLYIFRNKC